MSPAAPGAPAAPLADDLLFAALDAAIAAMVAIPVNTYDNAVPSCLDWTIADVLTHTTQVHLWATRRITAVPGEQVSFPREGMGSGATLHEAYERTADGLVAALRAADLDRAATTFFGDRTVRWWLRRQAQETTVHAWDATAALGSPLPIDPAIAIDGIDEMVEVFFVHRFKAEDFGGAGETMHLHATDPVSEGTGEWLVRFDPDGPVVTREHAKGEVAVRDTASNLLLFLWGRVDPSTLETFGDTTILERYQAVASY